MATADEAAGGRGTSLAEAVRALAQVLRDAGIETPDLDARMLVAAASGATREALLSDPDRALDQAAQLKLSEFRRRRSAGEPVSRILGQRGFYGRMFNVTPATLDPRPDTEILVDAVLELVVAEGWQSKPLRILDVGTGTGCLLITLLAELPAATGVGTDISAAALAVSRGNAVALGVDDRVVFETRRSLDGLDRTFDILVSNPPYIQTSAIAGLDVDVRMFDPLLALDGGTDGLDVYRDLTAGLVRVVPNGWSLFEIGASQADAVAKLACSAIPANRIGVYRSWLDLGGHTRCVAFRTQL